MLAPLLATVIIGIGLVAYALGYNNGSKDGHASGYVQGKTAGVKQWQRVLEGKRAPEAELVAVHPVRPPYDWSREGL